MVTVDWLSRETQIPFVAPNPYKATPTLKEAATAIYIDFEGGKGLSPSLLRSLYFEGKKQSDRRN